jgi:hypothetical protein
LSRDVEGALRAQKIISFHEVIAQKKKKNTIENNKQNVLQHFGLDHSSTARVSPNINTSMGEMGKYFLFLIPFEFQQEMQFPGRTEIKEEKIVSGDYF